MSSSIFSFGARYTNHILIKIANGSFKGGGVLVKSHTYLSYFLQFCARIKKQLAEVDFCLGGVSILVCTQTLDF